MIRRRGALDLGDWGGGPGLTRERARLASASSSAGGLLVDQVHAELRDRIVMLQIPPGEPIVEELVAAELGIGRTPVREAIQRLALENLVTVYPHRGPFASEINITDLADICDVRTQLERLAAYRASQRISVPQRVQARGLLAELDQSRDLDDGARLMALDARVHWFVYACAGNPYLEETLRCYFNLSLRIWHLMVDRLPHLFARVHEHDELLRAIIAGEADRARLVVAEHIGLFAQEIRAVL